jgi:tRNA dimethylallyltransferase
MQSGRAPTVNRLKAAVLGSGRKADKEDYVNNTPRDHGARPVLIAGPTASGKSALALALAERDSGIVINADALQVYDCWRVLSARPGASALARAPHALYGHVPAEVAYSVGTWLREIAGVLAGARAQGLRPIVVGGTGLYLSALTEGLAVIPPIPPDVRARSDALRAEGLLDVMRADLARRDPETWEAIDRRNPARVQRAWDVLTATGRGLAAWQRDGARPLVAPHECVRIVVNPPVPALNARIALRLGRMVDTGALEEVRAAVAAGWDPRRPSSKALGAVELAAHLRGELSLPEAVEAAATATRRYAKRQRTWLRGRMSDWHWLVPDTPEAAESLAEHVPPR